MSRRPRLHSRHADKYARRMLQAMLDLYQLLRAPRPLDELLQEILVTAVRCVPGAQRGSLMVLEDGRLHYRAALGYDLEALRPVTFPVDQVDSYVGGRRVAQFDDFQRWDEEHLSPAANSILREHGFIDQIRRSVVSSIRVEGQFYGTLSLDNLHSHRPFPAEAETLARIFAEQAGALLEQALLIERLRQTSTQLIEAEKLASLGRFIANVAHEINNPLTAVLGYAEFLNQADLASEPAAMLGQLRFGAERVRAIVRNLQLFARQQVSGLTQVSLNLLVEQILTLKQGELTHDQIELQMVLDPELPYTWADGGQLSQVLLNLLANAQYALRECPLPRCIRVETRLVASDGQPRLLVHIRDNGPGMTPEVQARIFEPFFTTRPAGQGTGLGLSICRVIVAEHGGTIEVVTAPGEGAHVTVSLPVRLAPAQPQPPAPFERPRALKPRGLRVLLIDDDPSVVEVVLRALEGSNTVDVAMSGRQGLELATDRPYDVVLSDIRMPELGGIELFQVLQAQCPEVAKRLLFISGDTGSVETRAALIATGRPLISKPFWPEELYAAIALILRSGE